MENNNDFLNSVHSQIDDDYMPENRGNGGMGGPSGGGVDFSKILPVVAILVAVVVLAVIFIPKILSRMSSKEEPTETTTEEITTEEYTTPFFEETTTEEFTTEEITTEIETTKKNRETTTKKKETTTKKSETTTKKVDPDDKVRALQNIPTFKYTYKDANGQTQTYEATWSEMQKTTKFDSISESDLNAYIAKVKAYSDANNLNSEIGDSINTLSKRASSYYSSQKTTAAPDNTPTTTVKSEETTTAAQAESGEIEATTKSK